MAGEDADDINISAVFIGQDGNFLKFDSLKLLWFSFVLRWAENPVSLPIQSGVSDEHVVKFKIVHYMFFSLFFKICFAADKWTTI